MAETIGIKVAVDTGGSVKSLGQLEDTASKLNEELRKVPLGSKEFNKLKDELIGVNREIKNTELSMEALDNEQVASEIGSVVGAVGDMTAAFILLGGDEDSALAETGRRIQTAIGVSMAFKGAIEGTISFQKLWNSTLKKTAVIQKIITAGQWAWGVAVGTTTGALKLLRLALIATGIGAIVIGITMLVMNFSKLVKWVKNITNGMGAFGKVIKTVIKIALAPLLLTIALVKKGLQALGIIESDEEKAKKKRASAERKRQADKRELIKQEIEQTRKLIAINKKQSEERIAQLNHEIAVQKALGKEVSKLIEKRRAQEEKAALEHSNEVALVQLKEIALLKETRAELQKAYEQHKNMGHAFGDEMAEIFKGHVDTTTQQIQAAAKVAGDAHDELVAVRRKNELEVIAEDKAEDDKEKAKAEKRKERRKVEKQAIFDLALAKKQADAEDIIDAEAKANALIKIESFKLEHQLQDKKLTDGQRTLLEFKTQEAIDKIQEDFEQKEIDRKAVLLADEIKLEEEQWQLLQEITNTEQELELLNLAQQYDEKFELAVGNAELEKELKKQQEIDIEAIDKKFRDAKIQADKEANQKTIQTMLELATQGANALQSLGDAVFAHKMKNVKKGSREEEAFARKQFKFNKALQLSLAFIDGAKAINASLAASPVAIGPIPNPAGIASLAFAAITSAAQIATIAAQQFSGGAAGGGFGGGGGIPGGGGVPQLGAVTNTSTLVPQEDQKVYVTETDISDTQNKVSVIEAQSTF